MAYTIHHGDCLEVLRGMADNSVDSVVTDPPYGLSFMGKKWDYDVPSEDIWRECLRVLKPGGHLLAFAGTRTQHRMAVRIEDAGFEIRDMIAWVYGSGFPKSLDVSKAIDKAAGAERTESFVRQDFAARSNKTKQRQSQCISGEKGVYTLPATEAARQWQGWGTALKPALEPITVARKPLVGTVAANVLEHGTGALNVDGCRVAVDPAVDDMLRAVERKPRISQTWEDGSGFKNESNALTGVPASGRWPANLIHDGSEEVVGLFPVTTSGGGDKRQKKPSAFNACVAGRSIGLPNGIGGDTGSAARFFYCAKASKRDRDEGLEGFDEQRSRKWRDDNGMKLTGSGNPRSEMSRNHHPTVKPTDLMRYLCRLVTPPRGTVLDPFAGSGSTGKAAVLEGFNFIGIEREAEYAKIAEARLRHASTQMDTLLPL